MTTLNEGRFAAEFLLSEAPGHFSRDNITVLSGEGKLAAGQVLGKTLVTATAAASAKAGNTGGSGAITMDVATPVLATAKVGRYSIICIEPAANAGVFEVTDPDGIVLGTVNAAGAAFANQIKFTIADATDFVSGDAFFVDVSAATYKYRSADPTNTDGSAVGCAVLFAPVDATSADAAGVGVTRQAEVNGNCLTYDAAVDDATKKALKVAELAAARIIVR
jgi:hypothetical protein